MELNGPSTSSGIYAVGSSRSFRKPNALTTSNTADALHLTLNRSNTSRSNPVSSSTLCFRTTSYFCAANFIGIDRPYRRSDNFSSSHHAYPAGTFENVNLPLASVVPWAIILLAGDSYLPSRVSRFVPSGLSSASRTCTTTSAAGSSTKLTSRGWPRM